jgi:hypothetical protein
MNSSSTLLSPRSWEQWLLPSTLAAAAATLLLFGQIINPVFLTTVILTLIATVVGYFRPFAGFLCYLFSIQVIDYVKRLLLVFGNPPQVEWYGILLLPDVILFAVVLGTLVASENRKLFHLPKYRAVAWALSLYAFWYTVRTLWTDAPLLNAVGKWKLVVPYFICFYLGERLINNLAALRVVLKLLAVTVGLAGLYGVWQLFFGLTGFEERWLYGGYTSLTLGTMLYGDGLTRVFSFYSDPATFCQLLACVMPLLLFSRRLFKPHWWNSWLLIGVMGAGMIATVIRSGWLLASLGAGMWWLQSDVRSSRKIVLLIVAVVGLTGVVWWTVSSVTAVDNQLLARAFVTGTYSDRAKGFENLLDKGIGGFVVGRGTASLSSSVRDISGSGFGSGPNLDSPEDVIAHDYITETLYELGWIGLGLIVFAVARSLGGAPPAYLGRFGPALQFLVFGVPLIAALFGGSAMEVRPVTTLVWTAAGILCSSGPHPMATRA